MKNIFKSPYLNALYAESYIVLLVCLGHTIGKPNTPDKFFDPIVALSLFVLSASVMGYLFLGEPIQLYLNGEKKQAVTFFMKTVFTFAIIAIVNVVILQVLQ